MQKLVRQILNQPVAASALVKALGLVGARFGIVLTVDDVIAIAIVIDIVLGVFVWKNVEPLAKQRERADDNRRTSPIPPPPPPAGD